MSLYRNIDRDIVQFDFVSNMSVKPSPFREEIEDLGGRLYEVPRFSLLNHYQYKSAWKEIIETGSWSVLHVHNTTPAFVILKLAKSKGISTIVHSHTSSSERGMKAKLKTYLRNKMRNMADYRFACSQNAGEWMFNDLEFTVLNNAVDISRFIFTEKERDEVRKQLSCDGMLLFGHIGRFIYEKNHQQILEIFAEIHARNMNTRLLLVGDGPLRAQIVDLANQMKLEDSIIFTGIRSDVPALLSSMDVFLFPSIFEGLPLTLVEAQASGLPCLVSDTVTDEVKITDSLVFMSLERPASEWAERALDMAKNHVRGDTSEDIIKAGYDIKETAKWLQDFYLREHDSHA